MRPSDHTAEIQVTIRLFASAREAVGTNTLEWTLAPGATVASVLERLGRDHSGLASLLPHLLLSVNQAYAQADQILANGDEIGVIPPVSGGATDIPINDDSKGSEDAVEAGRANRRARRAWVSDQPLDVNELFAAVAHPDAGAVLLFAGTVREHTGNKVTRSLTYEAYEEMAGTEMEAICSECEERWPAVRVAMVHRHGDLEIGEASILIAVASPHRPEAYEASRYALEELKARVPVWKKEIWSDGTSTWVNHS